MPQGQSSLVGKPRGRSQRCTAQVPDGKGLKNVLVHTSLGHSRKCLPMMCEMPFRSRGYMVPLKTSLGLFKRWLREELQEGRKVRRGDHLPPHKYIRNTSTCATTPTKPLLNAGRRPQTSQKARNSPTYLGRAKKKKEKTETKE